jgi:hypothetical protein
MNKKIMNNNNNLLETFIFIHDQNLIVEFEKTNKFSRLKKYKYVFLGKNPTDKIEGMDNVIISRNYTDNIEQYPLFTSYTGWYCLWKNNLITTDYVNLFEYDTLLSAEIEKHQTEICKQNIDMIGYVPFPMSNFHFVKNPKWNENILPLIKDLYNIDLIEYFDNILMKNPNSLWSSTSNTTFKKDVFIEYMEWFYPIGVKIKETETCGHAHERSITYFSHIKNKKLLLTNGLLKHLQLDSHKTQGHFVDLETSYNKLINNKI